MDYNFKIAGILPQMSHFYLSHRNHSKAVCFKCSTLFIPGANVTVEFIDEIPKDQNLIYKLNKKEKSKDYVLYTCRVCKGKTLLSGRQKEFNKTKNLPKSNNAAKKKIKKNILKDVLKKQDKESESFNLFDFIKNV